MLTINNDEAKIPNIIKEFLQDRYNLCCDTDDLDEFTIRSAIVLCKMGVWEDGKDILKDFILDISGYNKAVDIITNGKYKGDEYWE